MFELREYDQEATCQELTLDEDLFHRALEGGDKRYHVLNPKGEDFDIFYLDNNDDLEPIELYPAYIKGPYMAKYRMYDETDKETLYLKFLEGLRYLEFEELNEYTIALTRVVLSFTDMEVYCADPRIRWFLPEDARLHVENELPQLPPEKTLYVQKRYASGLDWRGYNRIFLATEDKEILRQMRDEFGDKVVVVAQERHSVSDFKSDQIINELEKETLSPEEYDARVEDKTINYFYALYLLSRCDSFMCFGQCNGWDVVNDFNGGKFQRCYKFSVGTEQEN